MKFRHAASMAALTLVLIPELASAGGPGKYSGHGFLYFGVDGPTSEFGQLLSVGGGGEAFIYKGLAAGADLAWLFPRQYFREGIGLLSVNPSYHFVDRVESRKIVPFVTAGYGLAFREGHANLYNYGGGATYWFKDRYGLRFEVRDYRHRQYGHFNLSIRLALAFR